MFGNAAMSHVLSWIRIDPTGTVPPGSTTSDDRRSSGRVVDVVDAVVRALSARDLESFVGCYAVDARIEDAGGTPIATGHGEIRLRYEEMFRLFPELCVRGRGRLTVGAYVVQEEEVLGRASEPGTTHRDLSPYERGPDRAGTIAQVTH